MDGVWTTWSDCPCTADRCPSHPSRKRRDHDGDEEEPQETKTRYRSCTMPRPSMGGDYCSGDQTEEVQCSTDFGDCSGKK